MSSDKHKESPPNLPLDIFFESDGVPMREFLLDLAIKHFAGESVVVHTRQWNQRHSYYMKWHLVDFEHRIERDVQLRRGLEKKFMPTVPHYRLRRLKKDQNRWHLCWVSSIGEGKSTFPLPDERANT